MNYYIQGDAANADKIKAAFEKLGYDISWPGGCANADVINISVERNGAKYVVEETSEYIKDIIKTHPDYKELELPVEPKFKIGDWIACDADPFTLSIKSVRDVNYYFHQGGSLPIKDIDEHYHLWTIQDAKDGDVLCTYEDNKPKIVFIYKDGDRVLLYHCFHNMLYNLQQFVTDVQPGCLAPNGNVKPATKEQHDLLFAKMKEAGYQWDADKKELRKIKPHYDIANFKPFDKVLTRDTEHGNWNVNLFSYYIDDEDARVVARFRCVNSLWTQCIPFNEDTKHLLGTTDMPDEMYINWKLRKI